MCCLLFSAQQIGSLSLIKMCCLLSRARLNSFSCLRSDYVAYFSARDCHLLLFQLNWGSNSHPKIKQDFFSFLFFFLLLINTFSILFDYFSPAFPHFSMHVLTCMRLHSRVQCLCMRMCVCVSVSVCLYLSECVLVVVGFAVGRFAQFDWIRRALIGFDRLLT